ncbi:MAG TPA: sodium:proton antiporter [Steroidobacteraceae bacterium]|nr:sodium:proton antiporter [Steroidobacteraceae bacterium]
MHLFEWLLILLAGAVVATAIARKLKLPYPSLLALGGTALALLPNTPEFALDPSLTLALFVAPVLLDAAFDTSVRDLKRMWIPVLCLVVIAVGVTTFAVAWLVHHLVPGMPWAACIALGAIVAPPDAAAASAVLRSLNIPHRMVVLLEGESLLNDATALLIYRLAVTAVMGTEFTGARIAWQAGAMLASVVVGFALAHLYTRITRLITDIPSSIVLQFVGTFGLWILADEIGLSAIVTVVVYAITASRVAPALTPPQLRLPSYAVWETVVFVLNVLAFVLIGLQLRPILAGLDAVERDQYLSVALAVLGTVVAVRLLWVFLYNRAAWLKTKLWGPGNWPGPNGPTLGGSLVVSWCGMRGIVTLAAAYALPAGGNGAAAFPYRELILLCAFTVVVGTLIVQGLTLRPLILAMGLKDDGSVEHEVRAAKHKLSRVALEILDGDGSEAARMLRDEFTAPAPDDDGTVPASHHSAHNRLRARVVEAQRDALVRLRDTAEIGDDAFRVIEEKLDRFEVNVR